MEEFLTVWFSLVLFGMSSCVVIYVFPSNKSQVVIFEEFSIFYTVSMQIKIHKFAIQNNQKKNTEADKKVDETPARIKRQF